MTAENDPTTGPSTTSQRGEVPSSSGSRRSNRVRAGVGRRWLYTRRWSVAATIVLVSMGVLSYSASANYTSAQPVSTVSDAGTMNLTLGADASGDLTVAAAYAAGTS